MTRGASKRCADGLGRRTDHCTLYATGPLILPGFGDNKLFDAAKQMEMECPPNGNEYQTFLNKILQTYGKHSVIFVSHFGALKMSGKMIPDDFQISFGSFWRPKKYEHVWILVDALLELNFPFASADHHSSETYN